MDAEKVKRACSETLVLSLLRERPMHGYELAKEIERRSERYFALKHSTLYPLLHRLEREGLATARWIREEGAKPTRQYALTGKGEAYRVESARLWRELVAALGRLVPEVAT